MLRVCIINSQIWLGSFSLVKFQLQHLGFQYNQLRNTSQSSTIFAMGFVYSITKNFWLLFIRLLLLPSFWHSKNLYVILLICTCRSSTTHCSLYVTLLVGLSGTWIAGNQQPQSSCGIIFEWLSGTSHSWKETFQSMFWNF